MTQVEAYIAYEMALLDIAPAEKRDVVLRNLGEATVMMAEEQQ